MQRIFIAGSSGVCRRELMHTSASRLFSKSLTTRGRFDGPSMTDGFVAWQVCSTFEIRGGEDDGTPFVASCWANGENDETVRRVVGGAIFGVAQSDSTLHYQGDMYPLRAGMYFVAPSAAYLDGGSGLIIVAYERDAVFTLGGPIENEGRLRYINGCTDTLLLAPWRLGEPCLNFLHFPPLTKQTQHTHPSARVGLVMRGTGTCVYGEMRRRVPLEVGTAFVIPTNLIHAFETSDDILDVVAWHPDSDVGPTDEHHPMINRTIISGVQLAP